MCWLPPQPPAVICPQPPLEARKPLRIECERLGLSPVILRQEANDEVGLVQVNANVSHNEPPCLIGRRPMRRDCYGVAPHSYSGSESHFVIRARDKLVTLLDGITSEESPKCVADPHPIFLRLLLEQESTTPSSFFLSRPVTPPPETINTLLPHYPLPYRSRHDFIVRSSFIAVSSAG